MNGYCQTAGSVCKRARGKTIQVECIGSMHGYLLSELWDESDDRVTRQAARVTVSGMYVRWLQVCAWHDCSYIAGIPLLAHGFTVNLSPCSCG